MYTYQQTGVQKQKSLFCLSKSSSSAPVVVSLVSPGSSGVCNCGGCQQRCWVNTFLQQGRLSTVSLIAILLYRGWASGSLPTFHWCGGDLGGLGCARQEDYGHKVCHFRNLNVNYKLLKTNTQSSIESSTTHQQNSHRDMFFPFV